MVFKKMGQNREEGTKKGENSAGGGRWRRSRRLSFGGPGARR